MVWWMGCSTNLGHFFGNRKLGRMAHNSRCDTCLSPRRIFALAAFTLDFEGLHPVRLMLLHQLCMIDTAITVGGRHVLELGGVRDCSDSLYGRRYVRAWR